MLFANKRTDAATPTSQTKTPITAFPPPQLLLLKNDVVPRRFKTLEEAAHLIDEVSCPAEPESAPN
jgi:hypothetical protein